MKIIITENQFEKLKNSEEPKVLHIPSFEIFDNDWGRMQRYLERKGNPLYSIGGDLDLEDTSIESLGNLTSVEGDFDLRNSSIKSLGNLTSVGGYLYLNNTPISNKHTKQEIKQMVNIEGEIYL
jgi:hypothetical protein